MYYQTEEIFMLVIVKSFKNRLKGKDCKRLQNRCIMSIILVIVPTYEAVFIVNEPTSVQPKNQSSEVVS